MVRCRVMFMIRLGSGYGTDVIQIGPNLSDAITLLLSLGIVAYSFDQSRYWNSQNMVVI